MNNFQKQTAKALDTIVAFGMAGSVVYALVLFAWFCPSAQAERLQFAPKVGGYDIKIPISDIDYMRVAKAISCAETSCGRDGTAVHRNNCCGVMRFWKDEKGNRQRAPKYYKKYEDSLHETARIWEEHYKELPNIALAKKWTGNDSPNIWMKNFYVAYNSQ